MKAKLVQLGLTALIVGTLAGCGGGGGTAATTAGTAGTGSTTTTPAASTVAIPTGTAPITLTTTTAPTVFTTLTPTVAVGGVTINSPPKVTFSVTDANGNAVIGLGSTCQSATMTLPKLTNLSFAIAKLVPGTGSAPSRWVSYVVMTVPTKNATTGAITASVPTTPDTENQGTLVDNKDGTYTYTFYTDVKQVAAGVAAATLTAPNVAADLDDLTYDPTLVHRVTIEVSGSAAGTGNNTPDCSLSSTAAVPLANPVDMIYDFIPATGKAVAVTDSGRDIVATAKCDACHSQLGGIASESVSAGTAVGGTPPSYLGLVSASASKTLNPGAGNTAGLFKAVSNDSAAAFHEGAKNDARYCVVCHTDQMKYGHAEASVTGLAFAAGGTYKIQARAVGDLPNHIHKIHMGTDLAMSGYQFASVAYNNVIYPQQITNCTTCHDGTGYVAGGGAADGTGAATVTAQGDDWKNVPSRKACGGCHDGINFVTGNGLTLSDAAIGLTSSTYGHVGGAQADDSNCALCHNATTIPVYHNMVTPETSAGTTAALLAFRAAQQNLPAGAYKFSYQLNSVTVNSSGQPVVNFQIQNNGKPVTFNAYSSKAGTEMLTGFGQTGPLIEIAFAVPQDGITAPADFNATSSATLPNLWNGSAGTLAGPDANGNYTATITGTTASPVKIPSSAVMVTAFLGYATHGTGIDGQWLQDAGFNGLSTSLYPSGLWLDGQDVQMVATGYKARRQVVSTANCNACHAQLGLFTGIRKTVADDSFHSGANNDANACAICHTPNEADGNMWSARIDYWVHGIHSAAKRTVPFTPSAAGVTAFPNIAYPGILKNCTACHLPGTYDFSAPASAAALPNMLFTTVATGSSKAQTNPASLPPYVAQTTGTSYGTGFSYSVATGVSTQATGASLVISPIMTACVACHDGVDATGVDPKQHMMQNGGAFYAARSTLYATGTTNLVNSESCLLCHGTGQVADIAVVHAQSAN